MHKRAVWELEENLYAQSYEVVVMSRIGRKPVAIPNGVKVELRDGFIEIAGPKGRLSRSLPSGIRVRVEGNEIFVERESEEKKIKALHGLTRALISNMVTGVTEGFTKSLDIVGVGYRAELLGKDTLKLSLGYSKPVEFSLPQGISVTVEERGTRVLIHGIDKELVGETAARIRRLRPPDSYKGKGIRYTGEILKLKPGKAGAKK
ncbi:MAG: 50S ribosomal protein L6 [Deltaproteobacteria bacterium]|nr:MAG: 50S ribosomal protein L6 [Deltaproteobacteria bacterium]